MILGRLLSALFEGGVVFVMTSNYPPDALYPNGLQRHAILPTIAMLKERLDIVEIDGGIDYRLRALEHGTAYIVAAAGTADAQLSALFDRMRAGPDETPALTVESRTIRARRRAGAWSGSTLPPVQGPSSQLDYLELPAASRSWSRTSPADPDMGNAAGALPGSSTSFTIIG
jgi:cell division protein ZapE